MNNFFDLIGRIFISSIFLFSGINKIFNFDNTIQWMESYGLNGILLYPAIILEIIMPILIIVGYQTKIAAVLLLLFSITTALIFHNDLSNQMQLIAFSKLISTSSAICEIALLSAKIVCLALAIIVDLSFKFYIFFRIKKSYIFRYTKQANLL